MGVPIRLSMNKNMCVNKIVFLANEQSEMRLAESKAESETRLVELTKQFETRLVMSFRPLFQLHSVINITSRYLFAQRMG